MSVPAVMAGVGKGWWLAAPGDSRWVLTASAACPAADVSLVPPAPAWSPWLAWSGACPVPARGR